MCAFFKSIDISIQTSYSRLNATSSVSIFQMTLTSLPAKRPRESSVVCLAFGSLSVIISLESRIVLYDIRGCVHKGITQYTGTSLEYMGALSLEIFRLVNRQFQSGERKQLTWCRGVMNITDFIKDHSAIGRTIPGTVIIQAPYEITAYPITQSVQWFELFE